jgi:hypothetical protein
MIEQRLRLEEKKRTIVADLFHALLHQLMTAQIKVQDLDLEGLRGTG